MFDVTKAHVQMLNDTDLRELVGRLCVAEVEQQGVSPKCVIWGGAQTTPDDGTDVSVNSDSGSLSGFVPCGCTVFQVKKNVMPPSAIEKEMCPNGIIRPLISSLNEYAGAYIIVSSGDDASAKMKSDRIDKMKEVLLSRKLTQVQVDFYDCQQLATWVNTLPSVVIWMQGRVAVQTSGWQPYDNWSNQVGGIDAEYVVDEKARIEFEGKPFSVVDGINLIRSKLRNNEKSIRIVGLSGVGKTRFLQALFDERIGDCSIHKSSVIYADTGHSPSPSPNAIVEYYIKTRKPVTIVIDNCPASLHKALTDMCVKGQGLVSVVTVEYDISDNDPEETAFFRLGTYSKEAMYKMLPSWNDELTYDIADKIYDLSDGNARLAKILCAAIKAHGEAVSLTNSEFFKKIFWQGSNENSDLLRVAEACSLVYSFDIEGSEATEVSILASTAEVSVPTFKRCVTELQKRDVIQARGKWRALLPQALANHIAEQALMYFEPTEDGILKKENKRLFYSFIKRLSYLYNDERAIKLSRKFIANMDVCSFGYTNTDIEAFSRIATIVPEDALSIIENNVKGFTNPLHMLENYTSRILTFIAYDPELFNRATGLLVSLYLNSKQSSHSNSMTEQSLLDLFSLHGSGTLAPIAQRVTFIKTLLQDGNLNRQILGSKLLSSALNIFRRKYIVSNPYSQRQRCNGYYPSDKDEWLGWSEQFLALYVETVISESNVAFTMLNQKDYRWRFLFRNIHLDGLTIPFCRRIRELYFWSEGLIDAEESLFYLKNPENDEDVDAINKSKEILCQIISILKPQNDLEHLILYQSEGYYYLHRFGYISEDENEAKVSAIEKAKSVSENGDITDYAMRYIVTNQTMISVEIGRGLCLGSKQPELFLQRYIKIAISVPQHEVRIAVLIGFLEELKKKNSHLCNETVAAIGENEALRHIYPALLSSLSVENMFQHLKNALSNESLYAHAFCDVWRSQAFKNLPICQHVEFYEALCCKPSGVAVAIDTFHMHFYREIKEASMHPDAIIIGRQLLLAFDFSEKYYQNLDHDLAEIFKVCSINWDVKKFVQNMYVYFSESGLTHNFSELLDSVIKLHPTIYLDIFLCEEQELSFYFPSAKFYENYESLTNAIDDETLMQWVSFRKDERCIRIAESMCLFSYRDEGITWLPIFEKLMSTHSKPLDVLKIALNSLTPMSWGGSRADIMQNHSNLIECLCSHENQDVRNYATEFLRAFNISIDAERKWEKERDKERAWENERFE